MNKLIMRFMGMYKERGVPKEPAPMTAKAMIDYAFHDDGNGTLTLKTRAERMKVMDN